jgi:cobalt/nickel transport system permease protein
MHHSYLDKYADGGSFFHRLDSRVKFMAAVVFTAAVLLSGSKAVAVLFCFAVGPFAVLVWAGIPLPFVFRRILAVCPFVLILALSCPLYDRQPEHVAVGPYVFSLTGGWLRCVSILGKFTVTMLILFALVSTTRFADLLAGLEKMKMPQILVIQLGMLYRYLFVLVDRVHHILRARNTRKLRNLGFRQETAVAAAMTGALFIRSIETSQKIQIAMQARGFCGQFHSLREMRMTQRDGLFIAVSTVFLVLVWWVVKPLLEGKLS